MDVDVSPVRTIAFWEDDAAVTASNKKTDIMRRIGAVDRTGRRQSHPFDEDLATTSSEARKTSD